MHFIDFVNIFQQIVSYADQRVFNCCKICHGYSVLLERWSFSVLQYFICDDAMVMEATYNTRLAQGTGVRYSERPVVAHGSSKQSNLRLWRNN